MKNYKAPVLEIVELEVVDVIQVSGVLGEDTSAQGFNTVSADGTKITHTNQGQEWLSSWN